MSKTVILLAYQVLWINTHFPLGSLNSRKRLTHTHTHTHTHTRTKGFILWHQRAIHIWFEHFNILEYLRSFQVILIMKLKKKTIEERHFVLLSFRKHDTLKDNIIENLDHNEKGYKTRLRIRKLEPQSLRNI